VWEDERSGYRDIYGARVDQSGNVLDPDGIAISTAVFWQESPSIAFDGTTYLVVWQDERSGQHHDIYGARVDQAGVVLDPSGIAVSTSANIERYPSVAFDGTNYLVVWEDYRNTSNPDIYGARLDQSGVVLDPSGIAVSTAPGRQKFPAIGFDSTNYLVVWDDDRRGEPDIFSTRISQSGIVLDTAGIAIAIPTGDQ